MSTVSAHLNRMGTVQMELNKWKHNFQPNPENQRTIVHQHALEDRPSRLNVLTTPYGPGLLIYYWGIF